MLDPDAVEQLLNATPVTNLPDSLVRQQLDHLITQLQVLDPFLEANAKERAAALLDAHTRVRTASRATGQVTVEPVLPVDVLGCFIYLPNG
jgi:hypothetical protein